MTTIFNQPDDLVKCVAQLARSEDFKGIARVCDEHAILASTSAKALYEWAWALVAMNEEEHAFEVFTLRAGKFGCSDAEALEFLTTSCHWYRARHVTMLGRILLGEQPATIRARIVAQALVENLAFRVDEDDALRCLLHILDKYSGSAAAFATAGMRLCEKEGYARGRKYLHAALSHMEYPVREKRNESGATGDDVIARLDGIEAGQLEAEDPFAVLAVEAVKLNRCRLGLSLLKRGEESEEAARQCGVICEQTGEWNMARLFYEHGRWHDDSFRVAVRSAGYLDVAEWLDTRGRTDEAAEVLAEGCASDVGAHRRLLVLLAETGKCSEALERAEAAVAANPGDESLLALSRHMKARIGEMTSLPRAKSA